MREFSFEMNLATYVNCTKDTHLSFHIHDREDHALDRFVEDLTQYQRESIIFQH
jgi:hypothetical protein